MGNLKSSVKRSHYIFIMFGYANFVVGGGWLAGVVITEIIVSERTLSLNILLSKQQPRKCHSIEQYREFI